MPSIINDITTVLSALKGFRADMNNEKNTQQQLHQVLTAKGFDFVREYYLDKNNIPDLFNAAAGIAIEVKIKGQKSAIFKQLLRYSRFEQVKILVLCSNKSLGLPTLINGKPAYYIHLGKAYL